LIISKVQQNVMGFNNTYVVFVVILNCWEVNTLNKKSCSKYEENSFLNQNI